MTRRAAEGGESARQSEFQTVFSAGRWVAVAVLYVLELGGWAFWRESA
jgi:hypothetical protein